jgi:uncharacterized protein (DUF305 family)
MIRSLAPAVAASVLLLSACSGTKAPDARDTSAAAAAPVAAPVAAAPASATPAAGATDADHDFLKAMSDHHKGMIGMAHITKDNKQKLTTKKLATRIDSEQDAELDAMVTMLEQDFKDPYTPKMSAADQALEDDLKTKTGKAYDRAFIDNTVAHHKAAVALIDAYLPNAKNEKVKALAAKMRTGLEGEIAELATHN